MDHKKNSRYSNGSNSSIRIEHQRSIPKLYELGIEQGGHLFSEEFLSTLKSSSAKAFSLSQHSYYDSLESQSPRGVLSSCSSNTDLNKFDHSKNISTFIGDLRYNHNNTRPVSRQRRPKSSIPSWALDHTGTLNPTITLSEILDTNEIVQFVTDKAGCDLLQSLLKTEQNPSLKRRLISAVVEDEHNFVLMSANTFGNYFMQEVISSIPKHDNHLIERVRKHLCHRMPELCLEKCACRVIQKAFEVFDIEQASTLVENLPRDDRLVMICNDQNANHVIQKVVATIPLEHWGFLVDFVAYKKLLDISQDKYGCRVIQTIIEELSGEYADGNNGKLWARNYKRTSQHALALGVIMTSLMANCQTLACNDFANFIIQFVLKAKGPLVEYRSQIINNCLLTNLLSMSQEKFGSHVVECAFANAERPELIEMMEEIFEGYVPHPQTGKDALDIMLFHQFGNYVVQQMIVICSNVVNSTEEGDKWRIQNIIWLKKINERVNVDKLRLTKFSSGKKIIDTLEKMGKFMREVNFDPCSVFDLPHGYELRV